MSPSQKSMHNCRQLEVMSGVVLLVGFQLARGISNNFLLLHQYCAKTLERGITKDLVRLGFIRRSQNWSSDQFLFQSVESNVTLRRPNVLDVLLEKILERLRDLRKVFNESSTIACETEEATELLHVLRRFPIHNCRHLLRIHSNTLGRDDMTKIKNLIEPKFALGELGVELMFPELVKNQTQVLGMIFLVLRENQNVVEIDQNEVIGVGVEDEVHHAREHRRSVDEAKRHDSVFI